MPPIWPKIHRFGSVVGHEGSIWNFGIAGSAVNAGCTIASAMRPMSAVLRIILAIHASFIDGTSGGDYTYARGHLGRRGDEQHHPEGERTRAHRGRRTLDAAAVHPSQRPRPAGPAVRLRTRPVRSVHRD